MEVVSKQISVGTSGSRKTSKVGVEEDVVGTSAAQEDGVEIRGQDKYQDDGDEHRLEETEETGNNEKDVQKVEQNKLKCKFCGKKYKKIGMLIKHIKNVHQEPKVKEQISCPKCKKVLSSQKCLAAHLKIHNRELSKTCYKCGLAFYTDFKLKVHVRNEHTEIVCGKDDCAFTGTAAEVSKHRHNKHRSGRSSMNK